MYLIIVYSSGDRSLTSTELDGMFV